MNQSTADAFLQRNLELRSRYVNLKHREALTDTLQRDESPPPSKLEPKPEIKHNGDVYIVKVRPFLQLRYRNS